MNLKVNDRKINWNSADSHYFFNPRHPKAQDLKRLAKSLPDFKGHIFLFSSSMNKICLLSKEAFLCSAQAVNQNLQTSGKDRWLISLPLFHVAGLSILARSFSGGFFHKKGLSQWQTESFRKELKENKISLCSLVPSQIHDLVYKNVKAPKTLRAVIVGGDHLNPSLYKKARNLNWPILPSYGLTETCSQVACADLKSLNKKTFPKMNLLNHVQIKALKSKVKVKSKGLLTAYFDIQKKTLQDPKDSKGWLELPDEVLLKNNSLLIQGRKDEVVKILGEKVNIQKLSFLLESLSSEKGKEFHLVAVPELRQGFDLALVTNCFDFLKVLSLTKKFNTKVSSFEKIKNIYFVNQIKKNHLFKVRPKELMREIGL